MATKNQATSIYLNRAEGLIDECVDTCITFTGTKDNVWQRANEVLLAWSATAPSGGSYHKIDFKVLYSDGEEYQGRYDLQHPTVECPNLAAHVDRFVRFHAGQFVESQLPEHMQNGGYAKWLASEWTAKIVPQYQHFAANYQIG